MRWLPPFLKNPPAAPAPVPRVAEGNETLGPRQITQMVPKPAGFDEARALHLQGDIAKAEERYRAIIRRTPDHFESLLYLAIIELGHTRAGESEHLTRRALAVNPASAEAHAQLAAALQARELHEDAIASYRRALALRPDFAEANYGLATAQQQLKKPQEALLQYEVAISTNPHFTEAYYGAATQLQALNRTDEAIRRYEEALAIDPDFAEASFGLGSALQALNRQDEALKRYKDALEIDDNYVEALIGVGVAFEAMNRPQEAVEAYRRAVSIDPDNVGIRNNLGRILSALGRDQEGIVEYIAALAIEPNYAEAHCNLAAAFVKLGRYDEAIFHCEKALAIKQDFGRAIMNLGTALAHASRHHDAAACFEKVIRLHPDSSEAYSGLSTVLVELGRTEEGRCAIEKAIELAPRKTSLYRDLAEIKLLMQDDPHFVTLQAIEREADSLGESEQMFLHFALGKAYADQKRYEESFSHLLKANALKRRETRYDEAKALENKKRIASVFSPRLMKEKSGSGNPSSVPVFILGMPRSGSTLVEQILANHPRVHAGGELLYLQQAATGIPLRSAVPMAFPDCVPFFGGDVFTEIGRRYVERLCALSPTADRITDKMPANFLVAGLIHLTLPNARIIHTRRDPVDTCLSCFSKRFGGEQPFTYDLRELGRYYRAYEELMKHWRAVLPDGVMLDVQYEEVVDDLDRKAREIVAHCGLEWNDACLKFYEAKRPVRTASVTQVRQPIYRSSVGRWLPYKHLLTPLLEELGIDAPEPTEAIEANPAASAR